MASGKLLPGLFKSNVNKLTMGIWPWTQGLKARLPLHYKKRYIEKHMRDPIPVHWRPSPAKYTVDEYGTKREIERIPIPVTYPPESHLGLWGGEGFVEGYKKKNDKKKKPATPKLWKPRLMKKFLYSEILDKWMEITVTKRTLDLIDEAYGFDYYILKTHEVDLQSKLGMRLKREMIMALIERSFYPDDPEKQQEIYDKYKQYIIPEEEVEWLGLSITQAELKQAAKEEAEAERQAVPLKLALTQQLLENLKIKQAEDAAESTPLFTNPFTKSK